MTLSEPEQMEKSIQTLDRILLFQKSIYSGGNLTAQDSLLFSKMVYRYECKTAPTTTQPKVSHYIEPLIGLLRDPLTICHHQDVPSRLALTGVEAELSKRFFLLGPSAPYTHFRFERTPTIPPWLYPSKGRKILFDLGASLFNGHEHPNQTTPSVGARWFYEYFNSLSLSFDLIIAFEYKEYSPRTYWNQIPEDLMGKLVFINVGVEEKGKFNPWNVLQSNARREDYVIVKLDIDTYSLESMLMQQVVGNDSVWGLIDEMFHEMHVGVKEMLNSWGGQPGTMKDTYDLFTKARHLGVRMHSWP